MLKSEEENTYCVKIIYFFLLILGRTGEPEPGVFGSLEPEPLEKKPGAGAAWKKSQEPEPLKN